MKAKGFCIQLTEPTTKKQTIVRKFRKCRLCGKPMADEKDILRDASAKKSWSILLNWKPVVIALLAR